MGFWELVGSTAEAVKRNAPDATPVKNACKSSYNYSAAALANADEAVAAPVKNAYRNACIYGSAAWGKIDQAARINGLYRLGELMPEDETKYKIGMFTAQFAKNAGLYALQEGYTLIPGGAAFSKVLSNTLNDIKYENLNSEKLEEKAGSPHKHLNGGRGFIDGAEMHGKGGAGSVSSGEFHVASAANRSPEDVIRVFMVKDIFSTRFLDDLMVHELAREKGKKPE